MLKQINAIVVRNPDDYGITVATVVATTDEASYKREIAETGYKPDAELLRKLITEAVSEWARKSHVGRLALASTSFDFNIGDLVMELGSMPADRMAEGDDDLVYYLRLKGIHSLEIETMDSEESHGWRYDDWLFDPELTDDILNESPSENNQTT